MSEVALVGITQPRVPGILSANDFIAYCARVSNPSNQLNVDTADKLVGYLIKNQHWSPFEIIHLTMEIKTTRDIGRQILRHRSFSFQEFSQRYAAVTEFSEPRETRSQDPKNRQNSVVDDNSTALNNDWYIQQMEILERVETIYKWAIENGIAKEQARAILPEGLTKTTMYMAGTLRSWIHYVQLRSGNGTQKEHREIALKAKAILIQEFPSLASHLDSTH